MFNIKLLNNISSAGLDRLDGNQFKAAADIENPEGILVRSYNMNSMEMPSNLLGVARAGVGVNNIPIDDLSKKGVVVFNTPSANANAVKELTLCGLLMSSRLIYDGITWTKTLTGKGDEITPLVEKGKADFTGPEIGGKTLGVIGLGAIGVMVANAAQNLGMHVLGYDPYISITAAWGLSRNVVPCTDLKQLFAQCDYISLHVPLTNETREILNAAAFEACKPGVRIVNFARGELVSNPDLKDAIEAGKVAFYITDFPSEELLATKNVLCMPHLGASTPESEDNCAIMAVDQLSNYILYGNIVNSVNFPNVELSKDFNTRICVLHQNTPSMITQISGVVSEKKLNIENMINKSKKDYAYTIIDINDKISQSDIEAIEKIENVIRVRVIQ